MNNQILSNSKISIRTLTNFRVQNTWKRKQQLTSKIKMKIHLGFQKAVHFSVRPSLVSLEICWKPNKWKSILVRKEKTLKGFKHSTSLTSYSNIMLNHRLNQNHALMNNGKLRYYMNTLEPPHLWAWNM